MAGADFELRSERGRGRGGLDLQIRSLNPSERAALNEALGLAVRLVDRPTGADAVQELFDSVLEFDDPPEHVVVALGLSFGQLILELSGFEWVRVKDEYGEETCVGVNNTQVFCAPISMIQKRLANRNRVDVLELARETVSTLKQLASSDEYKAR